MPRLQIDGKEVEVEEGISLIQACAEVGIEIPRFCYHEKLAIAGNCRMCLVEVEGARKPVASCSAIVSEGMVVHTSNANVKKAREGVMEFLLINHPLDCPICDQGGECDLQDQAMFYGKSQSRYSEAKRAVQDKDMGPLIKTHMTRCIHCTRCIRFSTDVAGVEEMGAIGRGENMEVATYVDKALTSELSGNMIDLCPVGALTSKPYAFTARSWELTKTESVDVLDAVGCSIRVDSKGDEVMRILPLIKEEINDEWISDKARFSYDGLANQRLDTPYIRNDKGRLEPASWKDAMFLVADKIRNTKPSNIQAVIGSLVELESAYLLQKFLSKLGSDNITANQWGYSFDNSARGNYLFNTSLERIKEADFCLLIGANPRHNAAVLNARIREAAMLGAKIYNIGKLIEQNYPMTNLGNNPQILEEIATGKHQLCGELMNAKKPMIIIGDGAYSRKDGLAILEQAHKVIARYDFIQDDWNGFNILHNTASIVGCLDLGMEAALKGKAELLYLHGADEIDLAKYEGSFIVYQGHHGDKSAAFADVIFPGAAYTEKEGMYINLEGRAQYGRKAVPLKGSAMEDWQIIHELSSYLDIDLGVNNLTEIRQELSKKIPAVKDIGEIVKNNFKPLQDCGNLLASEIKAFKTNFYMTDSISRSSATMAKCTKVRENG